VRSCVYFFSSSSLMTGYYNQPVVLQPMSIAPMQVRGNRNAANRPIGSDGKRGWSNSLCGCFSSCGICCNSLCCPCTVYSKNKQRLRNLMNHDAPLPGGGDACNCDCCCFFGLCLVGLPCILQMGTRRDVRDRYGIRGGACRDCCSSWLCGPCALTQERREIELEEYSF